MTPRNGGPSITHRNGRRTTIPLRYRRTIRPPAVPALTTPAGESRQRALSWLRTRPITPACRSFFVLHPLAPKLLHCHGPRISPLIRPHMSHSVAQPSHIRSAAIGADVRATFKGASVPTGSYLRVPVTFNPSSDNLSSPTLYDRNLTYTCKPAE